MLEEIALVVGLGGIAVHAAARVAEPATRGQILATRTVRDLTVGSELVFAEHGEHSLRGVPGTWELLAASD